MTLELVATKTEDFFGRSVEFREGADASLWVTAEQAAIPLGLSSGLQVRKLWANHKDEFIDGLECALVKLEVVDSRPSKGSERARVRKIQSLVFSLSGLDHLALLVRNEVGKKARRWTVDLRSRLRSGQAAVIDTSKLLERIADLERRLTEQTDLAAFLKGVDKQIAAGIAAALAHRKKGKHAHERLEALAKDHRQLRFTFAIECRVTDLAEKA